MNIEEPTILIARYDKFFHLELFDEDSVNQAEIDKMTDTQIDDLIIG